MGSMNLPRVIIMMYLPRNKINQIVLKHKQVSGMWLFFFFLCGEMEISLTRCQTLRFLTFFSYGKEKIDMQRSHFDDCANCTLSFEGSALKACY